MGRYRYMVAALLFMAGMINYMDRAALSVAAPLIRQELHLSPSEMGIIFSSFFFGYTIFTVGGTFADRYGPRRVFTWAMAGWSVICAATGAVSGFASLLACRAVFGVGEAPMCSTTTKAISNWFPRTETGTMIGVTFAGQPLGSALAGPIVGLVALEYGWRTSFVVIGLLGLAWVVAWRMLVTDQPGQHPRVSAAEIRLISESRGSYVPPEADTGSLLSFLTRRSVLAVGATLFAANYVLYFFLSWLPTYMTDVLHMDLQHMAVVSMIPWLCGAVGYIGGGLISDALARRSGNALAARKSVAMAALLGASVCVIGVVFAQSVVSAVALIAVATMFTTAVPQAAWGLVQELVPQSRVGAVGGFAHLLSNISGMIGPTVTGFAVEYLGGYSSSFALAGAVGLVGLVILACGVRSRAVVAPPNMVRVQEARA
jgi:MFS family permease